MDPNLRKVTQWTPVPDTGPESYAKHWCQLSASMSADDALACSGPVGSNIWCQLLLFRCLLASDSCRCQLFSWLVMISSKRLMSISLPSWSDSPCAMGMMVQKLMSTLLSPCANQIRWQRCHSVRPARFPRRRCIFGMFPDMNPGWFSDHKAGKSSCCYVIMMMICRGREKFEWGCWGQRWQTDWGRSTQLYRCTPSNLEVHELLEGGSVDRLPRGF